MKRFDPDEDPDQETRRLNRYHDDDVEYYERGRPLPYRDDDLDRYFPPAPPRFGSPKFLRYTLIALLLIVTGMVVKLGWNFNHGEGAQAVCVNLKNIDSVDDFNDPNSHVPGQCVGTRGEGPPEKAGDDATETDDKGKAKPGAAPIKVPKGSIGPYGTTRLSNAAVVVREGQKMGIPERGIVIALMTAMQECGLRNCATRVYPETLNYKPHQGESADHDSVGMFQQRPSSGWCGKKPINCMHPDYAARKFYRKLNCVTKREKCKASAYYPGGLDKKSKVKATRIAQAVQVSAYPNAYAKHEKTAWKIYQALK